MKCYRKYNIHISVYTDYPGCGIDGNIYTSCTVQSAYLASYLYPSQYTTSDSNTWKIEVQSGQYIELYVLDLDIPNYFNMVSFIEVFDMDLEGKRKGSLGRFDKSTMPHFCLKSSWHSMEIEFRILDSVIFGNGFFGRYEAKEIAFNSTATEGKTKYYCSLLFETHRKLCINGVKET